MTTTGHFTNAKENYECDFRCKMWNGCVQFEFEINSDMLVNPNCSRVYLDSKPNVHLTEYNFYKNGILTTPDPHMVEKRRYLMLDILLNRELPAMFNDTFFIDNFWRRQ